jgi:iron complex outermembrane receptor protein
MTKLVSISVALFGIAAGASAQQGAPSTGPGQATPQTAQELEPITVTGYVIPRIGEGPQPVVSLDQDFIQKQADQTVAQVVQRLPQDASPIVQTVNVGASFTPGAASANLRGLGSNSTLVLIDGHRQVPFPFFNNGTESFVDLNSIPFAAVDRIEVLKDGASATYGADAIAGVVNIILKDEYQGADLNLYYGTSQRGDAEEYHASLVGGISQKLGESSKFSILAAFDYYEQSPIESLNRGYAAIMDHQKFGSYFDQRSHRAPNGNFTDAAGNLYTVNPGVTGPNITSSDFTVYPATGDQISNRFNTAPYTELLPRSQRYGGYVKLNYQATQWLKFYDELFYVQNQELSQTAPEPTGSSDGIVVPASNPFNPFGLALTSSGQRFNELGAIKNDVTVDTLRNLAGITLLNLPNNWFVDATFLYAESDGDNETFNLYRKSQLNAALNGTLPGLVGEFYNPFTDQSVARPNSQFVNALRYNTFSKPRTELAIWGLKAGGDLINLPGGAITLGFGAEYRSDSFVDVRDRASTINDVVASGGAGGAGTRYVRSVYGELTIPILGGQWSWPGARVMEVVLAERYDDYSDFGGAAKPKISFWYKPFDDLTFQVTYAESFRAPSLSELFQGELVSFAPATDPVTGIPGNFEAHTFGNRGLKPETAYSYYAGVIWTPGAKEPENSWWGWANGFSAYLDWTEINKRDTIQIEDLNTVLANEFKVPGSVVRNPDGTISFINDPFVNVGAVRVDAIDFGASYITKEFSWGKVDAEIDASYLYNVKQQFLIPGPVLDLTNSFGLPDFRLTASIFYSKKMFDAGTFQTGFTVNYIDSEHDLNGPQPNGLVHRIGSWTTVDWQISYDLWKSTEVTYQPPHPGYGKDGNRLIGEKATSPKAEDSTFGMLQYLANTKITFGIKNIGDVRPPFADVPEGYDTQTANPIGRFLYIEFQKRF